MNQTFVGEIHGHIDTEPTKTRRMHISKTRAPSTHRLVGNPSGTFTSLDSFHQFDPITTDNFSFIVRPAFFSRGEGDMVHGRIRDWPVTVFRSNALV